MVHLDVNVLKPFGGEMQAKEVADLLELTIKRALRELASQAGQLNKQAIRNASVTSEVIQVNSITI
jgi:hypothetical protein